MKTLGSCLLGLAITVFYLAFFKLAPWLTQSIPRGDWYNY